MTYTPLRLLGGIFTAIGLALLITGGAAMAQTTATNAPDVDEGCIVVNIGGRTSGTLDCMNYELRQSVKQARRQLPVAGSSTAASPSFAVGGYNAAATAQAIAAHGASRAPAPPAPSVRR